MQVLVVERGSPGGAGQSWSGCQPSAWGGGEQGDGNCLLHFLLNALVGDLTYSFNQTERASDSFNLETANTFVPNGYLKEQGRLWMWVRFDMLHDLREWQVSLSQCIAM